MGLFHIKINLLFSNILIYLSKKIKWGEFMIAQVIINSTVKNLNKIFDYNIPTEMEGTICVGDRVLVPLEIKRV